ncbi:alpha/beta hydrolase [Aquabacterium lacunae]|uniref:Alpha/beta hydrolase n=1 Tax=Aquabacterium lacunae TaxID=2528630 RepID=A0A4Q9GW25_9BURK|nr:alpha/beta hydrolase [Aquabacterium lacunae]TBO29221.1 alpha/beta hydrolase [Aquabacterium lacunae]
MTTWTRLTLAVLLGAAALVGVGVANSWAPDLPVDALTARWGTPPSQFVRIEGMPVHVRDEGPRDDPAPIVLLHGTGASLHTWDGWVAELASEHRVVRIDLPGFGLTGPNPDGRYTLPRYSQFMNAVFEALRLQHVTLVGNSLGGAVAWKTAVDFPEKVSRLVLVDAGGYPSQATSVPIGFRLAANPDLAWLMDRVLPRATVESSVRNVYGDPAKVTPELVDRYFELTRREGNRQALRDRFAQMKGGELSAHIRRVKQPTLILWGSEDRLIPTTVAQQFMRDIEGAQIVTFDGLGHVPQEEDPVRTVRPFQQFLLSTPVVSPADTDPADTAAPAP